LQNNAEWQAAPCPPGQELTVRNRLTYILTWAMDPNSRDRGDPELIKTLDRVVPAAEKCLGEHHIFVPNDPNDPHILNVVRAFDYAKAGHKTPQGSNNDAHAREQWSLCLSELEHMDGGSS